MIKSFLFSDEESTVLSYLVANKAFPRLFEELNKAAYLRLKFCKGNHQKKDNLRS